MPFSRPFKLRLCAGSDNPLLVIITQPMTAAHASWVTYNSPLWRKDRIKSSEELFISSLVRPKLWPALEKDFVNDAIRTHTRSSNIPIIPTYNAEEDGCAQSYFRSPLVESIMARNRKLDNFKDTRKNRSLNKLSVRRKCVPTPNKFQLREMENGFVNDAIITERRRTKYKDIIPPYDARLDKYCKSYFEREDIARFLKKTCTPRFNTMVSDPLLRLRSTPRAGISDEAHHGSCSKSANVRRITAILDMETF